ncbi:MAG: ATP-binding protein, partial [Polyangiales bacterium]
FEKYIDGLAGDVYWHRGRCLAYGDGVAFWALAEMVRMRAGIIEAEEASSALDKLRASVTEFVPDVDERQWVELRLAHLLGLGEGGTHQREELFGAWRLYFERMAGKRPTVLMFEDMQWADASLLDFIEDLLDWSPNFPLYVVTLARPELTDRRPNWGAGKRNFHSLHLEPLPGTAMQELLVGLVPGLPSELRERILARTEGIPLYAVETVRMLLDRGLLALEGNSYKPTRPIDAIEVPGTLHALIAARLDGLSPAERELIQDASVLGKTFANAALSALSGIPEADLEPLLGSLARKEVLSVQADPRSPERGQYGFLQDIVRRVAYETLSKHDRKAKHLSAAAYLQRRWGPEEDEVVEVRASHLTEAYRATPDAPDAAEIKAEARRTLARAGEHAASLAANDEAERYFLQAAELSDDPVEQAGLLEQAGTMAWRAARPDDARESLERALAMFEEQKEDRAGARVTARLADLQWRAGKLDEAIEQMERSFKVLSRQEPDEDLGRIAAEMAKLEVFRGDNDASAEHIDLALEVAESLGLPELLSESLNTKSILLTQRGRYGEALALMKNALEVALEHRLGSTSLRAYGNLADMLGVRDRYEEALENHRAAIVLAGRIADRPNEWWLRSEITHPLMMLGRWDEALQRAAEVPEAQIEQLGLLSVVSSVVEIQIARGNIDEAERFQSILKRYGESRDLQEIGLYTHTRAAVLRAQGKNDEALERCMDVLETLMRGMGISHQLTKAMFWEACQAAIALHEADRVEQLLAMIGSLPPGHLSPLVRTHAALVRAQLGAMTGATEGVGAEFKAASSGYHEIRVPFWVAVTAFEHASWLSRNGHQAEAEPLRSEAAEIFTQLGADAWLAKLDASFGPDDGLRAAAPSSRVE